MPITPEQASIAKEFVKKLPEKERGDFIKRYDSLDSSKKEELLSRITAVSAPTQEEDTGTGDYLGTALGMGGLGAAAGLGALGVRGISNFIKAPQRELAPIDQQLAAIQQKIPSAEGMRPADIPSRLGREIADQRLQIKDFDDLTLATSAEDLTSSVKEVYPKLREANFKAYGDAIKAGEESISRAGKQLDTLRFDNDVINKTIEQLKLSVPEDQLKSLTPMIKEGLEKNISLGQAKKYLNGVMSQLPPEAQRTLKENWGNFLEKSGTSEARDILSSAGKKYTKFKEQDKALRNLIDPKTGEYDYDKLYRYTFQRAKTRINSDFKKLMSGLSEIEPEVGKKAKNLYDLRAKKIEMQRTLTTFRKWLTKAEELVSKREAILEKYPIRKGGLGAVLGAGKKILSGRFLGSLATGGIEGRLQDELFKQYFGGDVGTTFGALTGNKQNQEELFKEYQRRNIT